MSDTVIRVENLGKKYIIGRNREAERYTALRDVIANGAKGLVNKFRHPSSKSQHSNSEEFWALKDVSFEIKQGDRVGIIGRNGAGKSTLLKILSRITEPTKGQISIRGRVASLLEVGTGFHPELTGRENIYLNGAILGMSKAEIRRKFDEIVAFAEVEKFLDTPVKRYSSGMYVRLAFSVAAHLEPEILIVDEVLTVGDAQFQKKCLGKMKETNTSGQTLIFVSHNMSIIQSLCSRCLMMKLGQLALNDIPSAAVRQYVKDGESSTYFIRPQQVGKPSIVEGTLLQIPHTDDEIHFLVKIASDRYQEISLDLRLFDSTYTPIGFGSLGSLEYEKILKIKSGINVIKFFINTRNLSLGTYFVSLDLTVPNVEIYDRAESCLEFEIVRPPSNNSFRLMSQDWGYGCWEIPMEITSERKLLCVTRNN